MSWRKTTESVPNGHCEIKKEEIQVIGFHKEWIHPDFNPNGTRICTYYEEIWHCARWNASHDCYIDDCSEDESVSVGVPSHWTPSPLPPNDTIYLPKSIIQKG